MGPCIKSSLHVKSQKRDYKVLAAAQPAAKKKEEHMALATSSHAGAFGARGKEREDLLALVACGHTRAT
jgi:hypothetical protein